MTEKLTKEKLKYLREKYKPGTRIELINMDDPYSNLKPGEKGTVLGVDDGCNILMEWDCGSSLNLLIDVDTFRIINESNEK